VTGKSAQAWPVVQLKHADVPIPTTATSVDVAGMPHESAHHAGTTSPGGVTTTRPLPSTALFAVQTHQR